MSSVNYVLEHPDPKLHCIRAEGRDGSRPITGSEVEHARKLCMFNEGGTASNRPCLMTGAFLCYSRAIY